ncbi:MAG: hypothetical protein EBU88_14335, partial [Acidobacteria bacterium]|nr:hypothetical protein [Acidobacteriota bacterium]
MLAMYCYMYTQEGPDEPILVSYVSVYKDLPNVQKVRETRKWDLLEEITRTMQDWESRIKKVFRSRSPS